MKLLILLIVLPAVTSFYLGDTAERSKRAASWIISDRSLSKCSAEELRQILNKNMKEKIADSVTAIKEALKGKADYIIACDTMPIEYALLAEDFCHVKKKNVYCLVMKMINKNVDEMKEMVSGKIIETTTEAMEKVTTEAMMVEKSTEIMEKSAKMVETSTGKPVADKPTEAMENSTVVMEKSAMEKTDMIVENTTKEMKEDRTTAGVEPEPKEADELRRDKRATSKVNHESASKCNSEEIRQIMMKNIQNKVSDSVVAIQGALAKMADYIVSCDMVPIEYAAETEEWCNYKKHGVHCLVLRMTDKDAPVIKNSGALSTNTKMSAEATTVDDIDQDKSLITSEMPMKNSTLIMENME